MGLLRRNVQDSLMSAYLPGAAPSSGLLTRDALVRGLGWHRRGKAGSWVPYPGRPRFKCCSPSKEVVVWDRVPRFQTP